MHDLLLPSFLRRATPRAPLARVRAVLLAAASLAGAFHAAPQVPTTLADFEQPGTQPQTLGTEIVAAGQCFFCHGGFDPVSAPVDRWKSSMMANSARDPMFHAALAIANQDAVGAGELCIRCHSPAGWLGGRSTPTDGTALVGADYDGVSCNFCHRMTDPIADAANPAEDAGILAALAKPPLDPSHNGQYVVDPLDRRRGPFDPSVCQSYHEARQSPFHSESLLCATCHDVSNPAFTRVGGATPAASDTYVLNANGVEHPTHDRYDEFPIERTFSEWSRSAFAQGPVEMGGLFGGNQTAVSSCQDCHMPKIVGEACQPGFGGPTHPDLPIHDFNGANSWVPLAIWSLDQSLKLYGAGEISYVDLVDFQDAVARNKDMLARASELAVEQDGTALGVRITNQTGHKLPSGYPEGRRMWINVRFYDAQGALIAEHGAYDAATATLSTGDTTVYEVELGPDAAVSALTGVPVGPSFHFVLNNRIYKDNRIPPRGFTNAGFESVQAQPVGHAYADGQYWDDSTYAIPCEAAIAEVAVYHQTTTREYVEFLRDTNTTNNAGQIAYDEWLAAGKSAPVEMDHAIVSLAPRLEGDVPSLSVSAGGTQTLCANAGPTHAGKLYWTLGSLSGSAPGLALGGVLVPLNLDPYLLFTAQHPNSVPLPNGLGTLDTGGRATIAFTLPPGAAAGLVGAHADHAYGVIQGVSAVAVSNAAGVDLVP